MNGSFCLRDSAPRANVGRNPVKIVGTTCMHVGFHLAGQIIKKENKLIKKHAEELELLIRARYPIINVVSWEEERAEALIFEIARKRDKKLFIWSITQGITPYCEEEKSKFRLEASTKDPIAALNQVIKFIEPAIYIFKDFHHYLQDPTIIRKLRDIALHLKSSFKTLILLSPVLKIPCELEKDITVFDFPLPDLQDLNVLLTRLIEDVKDNPKVNVNICDYDKEQILKAALGLTSKEAENVFAKALVRNGTLDLNDVPIVLSEKQQIIKKSGILEYYNATEKIAEIGGLEILKEWLRKRKAALSEEAREFGLPHPKGVLILGVQGCGKSLTAKAISTLWNLPLLRLDMGRVFSSMVGSSEHNARMAIKTAESVAPSILWIDEIEKAFAGTQSSTFSDAGTAARVFGNFITWLQEKNSAVFVVATANNVRLLPPELLRKGRFDEIFFVDLPVNNEREDIFKIHLKKRGKNPDNIDIASLAGETRGFSGAEIEQVIISGLFDAFDSKSDLNTDIILNSVKQTIPLSVTMKEEINGLREWASTRTRKASLTKEPEVIPVDIGRKIELE
ncbi:MAG: AAA family ATPase [Candidatus Omnitrophota bacterium]